MELSGKLSVQFKKKGFQNIVIAKIKNSTLREMIGKVGILKAKLEVDNDDVIIGLLMEIVKNQNEKLFFCLPDYYNNEIVYGKDLYVIKNLMDNDELLNYHKKTFNQ